MTEALTDGIAAAVVGVGNAAEAVAKAQEQTGPAVDAVAWTRAARRRTRSTNSRSLSRRMTVP